MLPVVDRDGTRRFGRSSSPPECWLAFSVLPSVLGLAASAVFLWRAGAEHALVQVCLWAAAEKSNIRASG